MANSKQSNKSNVDLRGVLHATLGMQKTAYDAGVEKYNELSDRTRADFQDYVKRGAVVEADLRSKLEEFRGSDSVVAKGYARAEEQYNKLAESVENLGEDLKERVEEFKDSDSVAAKGYAAAEEQYQKLSDSVENLGEDLRERMQEFKDSDNFAAKGYARAEEEYQKLVERVEELQEKIKSMISGEASSKPAAKKKAPAKKKAAAKKAPAKKKAAAKKAPAKKAAKKAA